MRYWILLLGLLSPALQAALPDFKARYDVYGLGIKLGESHQLFRCKEETCTLHAHTFPTGMAAWVTKETLDETSTLRKTAGQMLWRRYLKRKLEGDRLKKTVTLVREDKQIRYVEKQRLFPLRQHLYDLLSLPVAISFYLDRRQPLPQPLYAQDNNWQDALKLVEQAQPVRYTFGRNTPETTEDDLLAAETTDGKNDKSIRTLRYTFDMPHARVRIWLMPQVHMLPAQVEIYRKDDRQTLLLKLSEPIETL